MSEGNPMEARITELEIKISYTEDAVDALNRTIFRQQLQEECRVSAQRRRTCRNSDRQAREQYKTVHRPMICLNVYV